MHTNQSLPLCDGLQYAAQTIEQVIKGQSLSQCLPKIPPSARGLTQSLCFYTLRHLNFAQFVQRKRLKKIPDPTFEALFLIAVCLIFAQKNADNPKNRQQRPVYRLETITNETVKAVKKNKKIQSLKNLMNACLRKTIRQYEALYNQAMKDPCVQFCFPQWWIQKIKHQYPDQWTEILKQSHNNPPMTLRVNLQQHTRDEYQAILLDHQIHSTPIGHAGLILNTPLPVDALPNFSQGACTVQDYGAQMAGELLLGQLEGFTTPLLTQTQPVKILDACAAPGGKATHLLEQTQAYMDILDISPTRLEKIQQNIQRLQIDPQRIRLICSDAKYSEPWFKEPYDIILADVPCTASGVIRRHPDIKYLRQPDDIEQTVQLQREILLNIWELLKTNGYLLYMTCSIFKEEGENQVQWILEHCQKSLRLSAPAQLLPITSTGQTSTHDGYFIALFQKT